MVTTSMEGTSMTFTWVDCVQMRLVLDELSATYDDVTANLSPPTSPPRREPAGKPSSATTLPLLSLFSLDELPASHLRRQHRQSFTLPPTPPLLPLFPAVAIALWQSDKTVARIEERNSAWIFVPKEYGKHLQAQHIGPEEAKQQYHYFGNKSRFSEPIMATVILYLSNVSQGVGNSQMKNNILSDCTKSSYALRPTRRNALLSFNLHPNTTPDQSSSHARCPVLDDEMWFATKFFHVKASDAQTVQFQADDSDCTDEEESCPQWAAIGECQRNPIFM
ncbi:hypothetical protein RJ639_031069, partial [Escallonia herrerae]